MLNEKTAAEFLKRKGWGVIPPDQWRIDMEEEFLGIWKKVSPFTMTSDERGYGLYKGIEYLSVNHIAGDIVECGVWKGGSCMLMALSLLSFGDSTRKLSLYDTFSGMTEPTEEDVIAWNNLSVSRKMAAEKEAGRDSFASWAVGMDEVMRNLGATGFPEDLISLVPGDVEETLKGGNLPEKIALLRLDTDFYASTKIELEVLYPRLVPRGILVIDDYGHFKGARRAVDEYFSGISPGRSPLMNRLDYTGRLMVKP